MKRPVLRLVVQIASVVLLLGAGVLALGPVRVGLGARFEQVKEQAVSELENLLGRRITYDRVSPSILRYLSIHDLTIHGRATEPADLLTVQQLRVYYRPLRLLRGEYSRAITEIRVENTALTMDTRVDGNLDGLLADILGERGEGGGDLSSLLPEDLVISGRNLRLSIRSELGLAEIERLFFTTSLASDTVSIRSQGDVSLSGTPAGFPLSNVTGRMEAAGTINASTGDTLLELSLPELASDLADLRSQVLQVRYSEGVVEARNVQSRDPIDLYVRYIEESGELYARVLADGYRLADLIRLRGEYEAVNRFLELPFSGQASATITPGSLSYGGSILTRIRDIDELPDGDLTLRFDGTPEGMEIDQLDFATEFGTASYRGSLALSPLRPDGELSVRDLVYGGIEPLTMTAQLRSRGDTISVASQSFTYAGTTFRSIAGSVSLADTLTTELTVDLGSRGPSRVEIQAEHAPDGSINRARVDARGVEPQRLVRIQEALLPGVTIPDLSILPDSTVVDTRVIIDRTRGVQLDVPLFYAYDPTQADDYLSFSLHYDDGSVEVIDLRASYQGYEGQGDFAALIEGSGAVSFDSEVVVEGIPYAFSGRYEPENSLEISGLYDVDARFYFGERGQLVFRASGDVPLPVGPAGEARLAFAGDGYFFSGDDWSVDIGRLTASNIPYGPVSAATFSLAGSFSPRGASLSAVGYRDAFSALAGTGEITWDLESPTGSIALVLGEGSDAVRVERYEITASWADEQIAAEAAVTALPLQRLGVETVRGALDGSVRVQGRLDSLAASGDLRLADGKFNNDPIELAASVAIDPSALRVTDASLRYVRNSARNVDAALSLADGTLELSGVFEQNGDGGSVSVGIDAAGRFDELSEYADVLSSDFVGTVELANLPVQEDLPSDWTFAVERSEGVTSARGGPLDAIALRLEPDGEFTGRVGGPLPLHFEGVGLLAGGAIEADLTNVRADVARLWSIIATPGFAFTGGTGTGSLRIVGPLNDPDFYGTLVAESVTAEVDLLPDEIGPARTFLVFDEKILSVREATVSAGNARARVSMEATLDRWLPEQYRVSVTTVDGPGLRVVNDFGGVAVEGRVSGTVTIDGDPATTFITGDIAASGTSITLSELPEETDEYTDPGDVRVDMRIRTGRGVEFRWPTNAFPILRGFADVGEAVRITYESADGTYSVTGGIEIQGGEVFYFDRSFYIREGRITFDEDEERFDPMLTVNAEIREVAEEGPVEIYLVADERPLSEFTPRWRSDPPMSEASILALLGGSVFVSESGRPIDLSDAVLLTSDLVSQFAIIRGFESSVRDALNLDLFSIRTQLFQNLLRGVIDQNQEYPLDNAVPSLGQYLDNTTLFMGKYLGTDLFLELLVQLSSSKPTTDGPRSLAGIEVESEVSLEFQTPFFLLEWSFFPRDPSSLFLADNTISFSWEYSY